MNKKENLTKDKNEEIKDKVNVTGAIITETADEQDPNILCLDCGFWRD